MARPRGRQKTARVTVNLENQVYAALISIAAKNDAPLTWVVRRAVLDLIEKEALRLDQPSLPLTRSETPMRGRDG